MRTPIPPSTTGHATGRGHRCAGSDAGGSLLEVLVAASLLAMVSLGLASLLLTTMLTQKSASDATQLAAVAGDRLERLLQVPFEDSSLLAGGDLAASLPGYSDDPFNGDPYRYVRWQVTDTSPIMKRLTVVAGLTNSVTLGTRESTVETYRLKTNP